MQQQKFKDIRWYMLKKISGSIPEANLKFTNHDKYF